MQHSRIVVELKILHMKLSPMLGTPSLLDTWTQGPEVHHTATVPTVAQLFLPFQVFFKARLRILFRLLLPLYTSCLTIFLSPPRNSRGSVWWRVRITISLRLRVQTGFGQELELLECRGAVGSELEKIRGHGYCPPSRRWVSSFQIGIFFFFRKNILGQEKAREG